MSGKNVNIFKDIMLEYFNSIETFFYLQKINISFMGRNVARFLKNSFIRDDLRWLWWENEENVTRSRK